MQQPTQNFSFRVMLHWDGHSAKRWVVGVWAVRRVSVNTLFDRLMGDQRRVIAKQKTMKEAQREAVGKNGEGVQILDAPSMSLLCPVSYRCCCWWWCSIIDECDPHFSTR